MADLREQLQSTLSGAYTIDRELGGGGMSRVFVADEVRLGRKVVVKVLSPELAAGISAERFEREIKVAASLQQANIVPVLSAGDTNGLPYYTMPFVDGESLRARLGKGPLEIAEVLRILGDVARALQYAHDRGIVHRDIKPDNVLLSGGTAVVTDFGIAKALSASRTESRGATLTQIGTSIGTPSYMAPEQAAGDPDVDHRADIYAFGCMAYELLAGQPPFNGRTPQRVLAAHMGEAPQPVSELRADTPPALAELVMGCLAKTADDRPQTAGEIIRVLQVITSGGGLPAMPSVLMNGPMAFRRALLTYAAAFVGVGIVAKAATISIGLPDWVFPGSIVVMVLVLPVILFTAYVHHATRRALTATPALTPGGSRKPQGTMATLAIKASPHVSWRRTSRLGMYGVGAFAVLIVAFMVMRALGIGPAGSLLASGKLEQRAPVLIADFTAHNTDSTVAGVVVEGVRANLSQSASITLMSPATLAAALRRMQRQPTSRVDLPLARQIAAREGVKAIVDGDVTGLGGGFVIALRLVTADSGNVLASYQTTVDGPKELISGIDDVSRKLRAKIGESLRSVQGSPPLEQVTTASLEALRAYSAGNRANDVERNFPKAVELLRQAVSIDTGFAMAWRKLGVAEGNAQYPQSARDSALTKAYQLRARLTDNERLLAEAFYFSGGPGRDRNKAIVAYQALLQRGESTTTFNNLGVLYSTRREYARAESAYTASIKHAPDLLLGYTNLVVALVSQGKFAEAKTAVAEVARKAPGNPANPQGRIALSYAEGKFDSTNFLIDTAVTSTNPQTRRFALQAGAFMRVLSGRLREADVWRQRLAAQDSIMHLPNTPLADSLNVATTEGWLEEQAQPTLKRVDAALTKMPIEKLPEADRPYPLAVMGYLRAGRPDRARAMLAAFSQTKDTALLRFRQPQIHVLQGEIALAEKRPRDAMSEFRQGDQAPDGPATGDPLTLPVNLARAFDAAEMPDSAILYFERYVTTPYWQRPADDFLYLAGSYKRLGELYDTKGDRAKAVSYYAKFVDLWKNADPELQPKVQEVRKRLARLSDMERR